MLCSEIESPVISKMKSSFLLSISTISSLVHELLGHAYSADAGTFTQNKNIKVGTNNQEQINAIDILNVYKKTVNIPLRTTDIDKNEMEYDISKYLNLEADNK